jgi:hypothetical protein
VTVYQLTKNLPSFLLKYKFQGFTLFLGSSMGEMFEFLSQKRIYGQTLADLKSEQSISGESIECGKYIFINMKFIAHQTDVHKILRKNLLNIWPIDNSEGVDEVMWAFETATHICTEVGFNLDFKPTK